VGEILHSDNYNNSCIRKLYILKPVLYKMDNVNMERVDIFYFL
jgi:hypothetical protein